MRWGLGLGLALLLVTAARAEVVRLEVRDRRDWAPGRVFAAGAYEILSGTAWYEIDPDSPQARDITDVRLAPRNVRGKVEYHGPFLILRPKQADKSNGAVVFEVANRGSDQTNGILFDASDFELTKPAGATEVGRAPLFDRGYMFAWAGWQSDLAGDAFGLVVPRARVNGPVRAAEFVWEDGGRNDGGSARIGGSCAADVNDRTAVLRIHRRFDDPGEVVPRDRWRFATRGKDGVEKPDPCAFLLDAPLTAPALVTIIYRGDNPQVAGLGLAAVRDFAAHLRSNAVAGRQAPTTVIAYGYSQSARFLRDFLYRGFNKLSGRPVFDGVLDAGSGAGRGSFAHRYANPGDAGNSVGSALRPVDLYPFADLPTPDIAGAAREGLLDRARRDGAAPKMFHILSGTEYWARAGSLMQATPDGRSALPEAPDTRTYVFAGTNHAPRSPFAFVRPKRRADYPYNDNADEFTAMPALVEAMRRWIVEGAAPPPTQRPEVGATLVDPDSLAFPAIPGVTVPKAPPPVWRLTFGPDHRSRGVLVEPPLIGPRYKLLVPQVDEDGNELGGWLGLRRSLPIGTYTAWNGPDPHYSAFGTLSGLAGALIPFPWDEAERTQLKDPRRSLVARYGSADGYMRQADREIERQITAGFLLPDERAWARDQMLANWTRADALTFLWPRPKT